MSRKPRGTDKSIGIEEFLDEMQPSVNRMYSEWKQAGLDDSSFFDELRKYINETCFAFDEHGNMERTETRSRNIDRIARFLFDEALRK